MGDRVVRSNNFGRRPQTVGARTGKGTQADKKIHTAEQRRRGRK